MFVIVDNGSAHRGKRSIDRLQGTWPNLILVHTPIHASWLNQAEIYFSIVQRKVVTPNDFADLDTLEHHLLAFGRRYEQIAAPFQWKFTRTDLNELLAKTDTPQARIPRRLTPHPDTSANLRARPLSQADDDRARRALDDARDEVEHALAGAERDVLVEARRGGCCRR